MTTEIKFSIRGFNPGCNEILGIVGNIPELGKWRLKNSLILTRSGNAEDAWNGSLLVNTGTEIKYRYFSGTLLQSHQSSEKIVLVNTWEVHATPRCLVAPKSSTFDVDDGHFGTVCGKNMLDRGWLTYQHEFRFYISSPKNKPFLQLSPAYLKQKSVDMTSLRVRAEISPSATNSTTVVISPCQADKVTGGDFPLPCNDHVTITAQTLTAEDLYIKLHILNGSHLLGIGVLSCFSLSSKGTAHIPLLDDQFTVIGTLRVTYLHIQPFSANMSMECSYSKYWKKRPLVHVGHRGSGNSFTSETLANQFENTLSSFIQASESGAAYVEFDVHLSKDGIPIVYHDLTTCVAVKQKASNDTQLLEVPVMQLKLSELKSLKISHRSRMKPTRKLVIDENDLSPLPQPFPTLAETFASVPLQTGFNIEVKWPCLNEKGVFEDDLEHYIDANTFVDSILEVVFEAAHSRKIIFSSFDVDICIMLRRKQNRYPVLFLTNGDTGHYTPMLDRRESSNEMAIGTCVAEGFLGIDSLAKDVHQFPAIIEKAHKAGLLFACYGDDVGDNLNIMEKRKVDIAIYDRIYEKTLVQ